MMPGWMWALVVIGPWLLFCLGMATYHHRRDMRELKELDRRLDVYQQWINDWNQPKPDLDEVELRAQMDYDAYRFQYKLPGERS